MHQTKRSALLRLFPAPFRGFARDSVEQRIVTKASEVLRSPRQLGTAVAGHSTDIAALLIDVRARKPGAMRKLNAFLEDCAFDRAEQLIGPSAASTTHSRVQSIRLPGAAS